MTQPLEPIHPNGGGDDLTKLEYFAGLALQGLLANPENGNYDAPLEQVAVEYSIRLMQELNKARDKKNN